MANEIHDPILLGDAIVVSPPSGPNSIVNRQHVDKSLGIIYVSHVESLVGNVGVFEYALTTPPDKVITAFRSDTKILRIHFVVFQNSDLYSPEITCITSTGSYIDAFVFEDDMQARKFYGYVDVTIEATETITLVTSKGLVTEVLVRYAAVGPTIQSVVIGDYPEGQTAVSENQTVSITGTVPNVTTSIVIADEANAAISGEFVFGEDDSAGNMRKTFTGFVVIGNLNGEVPIKLQATNILGSRGSVFTTEVLHLDQSGPTVSTPIVLYPEGQIALSEGQTATIALTAVPGTFDTVLYTTASTLSVSAPTEYEDPKTVTCVGLGDDEDTLNLTAVFAKTSNGKTVEIHINIPVLNSAATVNASINTDTTLFSSPEGNDYLVSLIFNQTNMLNVSVETTSGTFVDTWTYVGDNTYTNTLRISDTDPKGLNSISIAATNGVGLETSTIDNDTAVFYVGGFNTRDIEVPPFARKVFIGTNIFNINKVTVKVKGSSYYLETRHDVNDYAGSFTITDESGNYDPFGSYLWLNDVDIAMSNTSGTLVLQITEGD